MKRIKVGTVPVFSSGLLIADARESFSLAGWKTPSETGETPLPSSREDGEKWGVFCKTPQGGFATVYAVYEENRLRGYEIRF